MMGKWCIGPQKGHPRTPGMEFLCRVPRPHFLGRGWSGPAASASIFWSVWIISFEFVKVCGIRFSIWESFIGFYICCYPISTILTCLFSVGVRISWKKLCWMRACRRKWHLVSVVTQYRLTNQRQNLLRIHIYRVGRTERFLEASTK